MKAVKKKKMSKSCSYKFIKEINQGTFGTVSLFNSKYGLVCIKKIKMPINENERKLVKRELYITSQVKHPNIIKFLESFIRNDIIHIVMEYANRGTLREYVKQNLTKLTKDEIIKIICEILMGLEYLHIRHVIHRDLKPENVLIDDIGKIKIADFGLSFIHAKDRIKDFALGTPLYLAPELIKDGNCDFKSDIWSLGCILYELCEGKTPFQTIVKTSEELFNILRNPIYYHITCANIRFKEYFQNLCEQMLTFNPQMRISLPDIVLNPLILFTSYNMYFQYLY